MRKGRKNQWYSDNILSLRMLLPRTGQVVNKIQRTQKSLRKKSYVNNRMFF